MNDRQLQILTALLANKIQGAKDRLDIFKHKLVESPHYALRWSGDAFEAASQLQVYTEVQRNISTCNLNDLLRHCQAQVLSKAQFPPSSTSVVANLVDTQDLRVWADLTEYLTGLKEYGQ